MNIKNRALSFALALVMFALVITLCFTVIVSAETEKPEIDVWLIGGQSNAVGFAPVDDTVTNKIPEAQTDTRYQNGFEDVLFYGISQDNITPEFTPVKIGQGKAAGYIGAEMGIAKTLSGGERPNAIIKAAWGGTYLYPTTDGTQTEAYGTWTPPSYFEKYDIDPTGTNMGKLYNEFVRTVTEGVKKLDEMGYTPVLRGMWWMQGCAESPYEAKAEVYDVLLECLIKDVRGAMTDIFGTDQSNMPFVLGNIYRNQKKDSDGNFVYPQHPCVHLINEKQALVAERVNNVTIVSNGFDEAWGYEIDGYTDRDFFAQVDSWHFNAQTQIYLGEQFVKAVIAQSGKYSVTLDGKNATMTGSGAYSEGDSVTVTVTPASGCNITSVTANGGTVALSDLGEGKYSFTMPNENVVIKVVSVNPNDEEIPGFGVIPAKYADKQAYPFLMFKNGELVSAFTTWGSFVNGNNINGATLLLRRDYTFTTSEGNYGICYMTDITLDLGENEITYEKGPFFMLMTRDTLVHSTKVTVKNGSVKLNDTYLKDGTPTGAFPFIAFSSYNSENTTTKDYFELVFEGIEFDINSGRGLLTTYTDGTVGSDGKLVFNDCVFDYTASKRATTLFKMAESTQNKHDTEVIINGGVLKTAGTHKITFATFSAQRDGEYGLPDSLSFGNGSDGEAFTVELTSGKTLANAINTSVYPLTAALGDTVDKYSDFVNLTTPYGVISSAYADAEKYPLVAFNSDGSFKVADTWKALMDSKLSGAEGCVLYLRRDYSTKEPGVSSSCWGMIKIKDLTIDLGGHTFSREAYHMFHASGRDAAQYTCKITVKNGTLKAVDNPLICINNDATNNNSTTVDMFDFVFDGITVDISAGRNIIVCYNNQNAKTLTKLTLNDCTINRGSSSAVLFNLNGTDTTNKFDIEVNIKGGVLKSTSASGLNFVTYSAERDGAVPDKLTVDDNFKVELSGTGAFGSKYTFADGSFALALTDEADGKKIYSFFKISTPYGDIPVRYADDTKFPFVIMKDGVFVDDSKITSTQWKPLINTYLSGDYKSGYTLYLRRDYSTSESGDTWMLCHIDDVVIDLGGHIFTRGNYQMFQAMERDTTNHSTKITLKNGTLCSAGKTPLICFTSNTTSAGSTDSFEFIFDGVTFDVSHGVGIAVAFKDGKGNTTDKITLNDCEIYRGSSATCPVFFNLADERNAHDVAVTVNGGKLVMDSVSGFKIMTMLNEERNAGEGSPDKFVQGRYNGDYLRLVLPASANAPTADYHGYKFIKESTDGTATTYTLVPASSVGLDFTPKASVTLDANLIFNIYLPAHAGLGEVTLNGEAVELGEAVGDYYLITKELSADKAASLLKLTVNLTVSGSPLKGTFVFSTVKYAQKLLGMESASATEKTLIKDMLSYIRSAYNYFDAEDKATVSAEIDAVLNGYASTAAIDTGDAKCEVDGLSGATFVLGANPAIRFYLDTYTADKFSFKVGERTLSASEANTGSDTYGDYIEFTLYAYEMTEVFSYEIRDTEISGEYNLIAYYADANTQADAELCDLVTKFYNYCYSASEYRNAVVGG